MSFVDNGVDFEERSTISTKYVANFAIIIYNMVSKTVLLDVFVAQVAFTLAILSVQFESLPFGKTKLNLEMQRMEIAHLADDGNCFCLNKSKT